jgi:hypothetical protein
LSGAIAHSINDPWNLLAHDPGKQDTWFAVGVIVGLSTLAYVFSTLGTLMRELLEGRHILEWPWLMRDGHYQQQKKLDSLSDCFRDRSDQLAALQIADWKVQLQEANVVGLTTNQCGYPSAKLNDTGYLAFTKLRELRMHGQLIGFDDLQRSVLYFQDILGTNSTKEANSAPLVEDYRQMRETLEYAQDRVAWDRTRYFKWRQFRFPGVFLEREPGAPSAPSNMLAATEMGNIARTIRSYALNRYSLDLDVLWSRLQPIVQNKKDLYASLQDAKTQLDFLVSLCWLTAVFWVLWAVLLPVYSRKYFLFGLVMIVGPTLDWLWYRLACQSYTAFADLMRTPVDLYRFELLDSLNLSRPRDLSDEKKLWERIAQSIGFENTSDQFEYKVDRK